MGHANPNVEDGCRGEGEEPMGSKLPFADKEKERERERERERDDGADTRRGDP
jgi:hypothetical protein